jgi:hypothetical protein
MVLVHAFCMHTHVMSTVRSITVSHPSHDLAEISAIKASLVAHAAERSGFICLTYKLVDFDTRQLGHCVPELYDLS